MNSIKFCYLYRDGSNYKSWAEVIFSNHENLAVNKITEILLRALLPDKQFIASQVSVPENFLFKDGNFTKFDHCYHEFDCIEVCKDEPTDILGRSITSFLQDIETASKQGWKVFEVLDRA